MRLSRRQQLFQLARSGLGKLIELLLRLEAKLRRLLGEVSALRRQVKELKARLALNSTNSSKPPSSDGLAKPAPKSLRTRTGRRPGGQPGHPGQTLQPVVRPHHEIVHRLERCTCGACHAVVVGTVRGAACGHGLAASSTSAGQGGWVMAKLMVAVEAGAWAVTTNPGLSCFPEQMTAIGCCPPRRTNYPGHRVNRQPTGQFDLQLECAFLSVQIGVIIPS